MKFTEIKFYLIIVSSVLFVSIPLFYLSYTSAAIVSFALAVVYVLINTNLNVLAKIAMWLKWPKLNYLLLGFFGIKNIFYFLLFMLLIKAQLINSNLELSIMVFYYAVFSGVLAWKMLQTEFKEVK